VRRTLYYRSIVAAVVLGIGGGLSADPGEPHYADRSIDPQFVAMQGPVAPIQPEQPELPEPRIEAGAPEDIESAWGGAVSLSDLPTELAASPVASVVSGEEAAIRGTTDVGDLLEQSGDTGNVMLFTRSPISNEPRIRGYRYAQIRNTVDGACFFPIRPDLDTPLSRIDSSIIRDVSIIDGPYTVRQGPGFAFINVQLKETERCCCGTGVLGHTAGSYDTNGEAWYGTQSFHGGGGNYGYRIGYVQRTGVDFTAGGGFPVAASHNMRNWNCSFGYDPSRDGSFEFSYIRNDLTDIDLPSQINDLALLTADAFQLCYTLENQHLYDHLRINLWYNAGRFRGTPAHKINPWNPGVPLTNLTWGRNYSAGGRMIMTWGTPEDGQLAAGADFTLERHHYLELTSLALFGIAPVKVYDTGLFLDVILPVSDRLVVKAGGRIDLVRTNPEGQVGFIPNGDRPRSFTLGAGYVIGEYELTDELTATAGFGVSQCAPTPTDLYAWLPYLAILQEGPLFFPIGNPDLTEQTAQQIDVGLTADYADFHGGIRGFYSWIDHFITYNWVTTANEDAALAGGELYGELRSNGRLTPFASLSYVEGNVQDVTALYGPLWGIPPLQALVGLRLSDCWDGRKWGMEYRARIVDGQYRTNQTAGSGELPTPGFVTHDMRGYWHINHAVTFVAGVENLGNRNYQEHLDSRIDMNYGHPGGVFRRGRNFYFLVQSEY